jgi:type II secretory pathway pseudopilin PulG
VYKQQVGVTLIEVVLVLVLGASILMMGIRQYQSFKRDTDVQQLKYNVDMLFQALANFYYANCGFGIPKAGDTPTPGRLSPTYSPAPTTPYTSISAMYLATNGFLNTTLPLNPLVDNSGEQYNGYTVQFNQYHSDRMIPTRGSPPSSLVKMGTVYIWKAQVAVKLKQAAQAEQYKSLLGADCSASDPHALCSSASSGDYLIWERMPSFATPSSESNYGLTNQTNKQFNQMYTTYPILNLTNGTRSNDQFFLCGS